MLKFFLGGFLSIAIVAVAVVGVTGAGLHKTYTPSSVAIELDGEPIAHTEPRGIVIDSDLLAPSCSSIDRNLTTNMTHDATSATLEIGSYVVRKRIPVVQSCADGKRPVVTRAALPGSWFLKDGTRELYVVVGGNTNKLTFTNRNGNYSLTKVSGNSIRIEDRD